MEHVLPALIYSSPKSCRAVLYSAWWQYCSKSWPTGKYMESSKGLFCHGSHLESEVSLGKLEPLR